MNSRRQIQVCLFLVIYLVLNLASTVTGTAPPHVTATETSHLQYRSVFTHYQRFSDQPLFSWREANDVVDKIGGWRFYAKEAILPDASDKFTDPKTHSEVNEPVLPSTKTDSHPGHEVNP